MQRNGRVRSGDVSIFYRVPDQAPQELVAAVRKFTANA
jgi:hypothetical protein